MDECNGQLRRKDVPWFLNGTLAAFIYVGAAVSIAVGMAVDPEFADARPGIIDGSIGLVLGGLGGTVAGHCLAKDAVRIVRLGLNSWQLRSAYSPSRIVIMATFFGSIFPSAIIGHLLWQVYRLPFPWFGPGEAIPGGGSAAFICYSAGIGVTMYRWYRSLPE